MALAQRKDRRGGPFLPSLTVWDFLPIYPYRSRGGQGPWSVFVNWPLVVAGFAGYLFACWVHGV